MSPSRTGTDSLKSPDVLLIWVLRGGDGPPFLLGGYLRIGRGGSLVDNQTSGGLVARIDPATGTLDPATNGHVDRPRYAAHPDHAAPIEGEIRPIHHRLDDRVRAHIFLCMLAYYVEWHMREAWRELLFADEDLEAKLTRDPVAPAKRSAKALQKITERTLADGSPVHSFRTLLEELATIVRNTCVTRGATTPAPVFQMLTTPNATQHRAVQLLQQISV